MRGGRLEVGRGEERMDIQIAGEKDCVDVTGF